MARVLHSMSGMNTTNFRKVITVGKANTNDKVKRVAVQLIALGASVIDASFLDGCDDGENYAYGQFEIEGSADVMTKVYRYIDSIASNRNAVI